MGILTRPDHGDPVFHGGFRPRYEWMEIFPSTIPPQKRAFLIAYAETGKLRAAAEAAGYSPGIHRSPPWATDEEFQEALVRAQGIAADTLEDEATRRARDGVRRYKFDKEGRVLRNPNECDCGAPRKDHLRMPDGAWGPHPDPMRDCSGFEAAPYYEHEYSDTLMIFLLKGLLPDKYAERREFRGLVGRVDIGGLPDEAVQRIADGEHPLAVVADMASRQGKTPGELMGIAPGSEAE